MTLAQELGKVLAALAELDELDKGDDEGKYTDMLWATRTRAMGFIRTHGPALLALAESAERPVAWRVSGEGCWLSKRWQTDEISELAKTYAAEKGWLIEYAYALPPAYRGGEG